MEKKVKKKIKGKSKYKKDILCLFFIIVIGLVFIFLFVRDISTIGYKLNNPYFLGEFFNNIENADSEGILFQVQASIATLGLAIIALLSESYKQYFFGISISNYIMNDKYLTNKYMGIFRYKTIIVTELVLVGANYFFVAGGFKRLPILIFLISIGLVIFMCCSIFSIFSGTRQLKDEMKKFYFDFFKNTNDKENNERCKSILNNLDRDIKENFEGNYLVNFYEDFEFLSSLFQPIIYKNNENIIDKWQKIYSSNCSIVFKKKDSEVVGKILDSINDLYKKCNEYNNNNTKFIYLRVWDNVEIDFFKNIPEIMRSEMVNILMDLHSKLYKNINSNFDENDLLDHDLKRFPYYIYEFIYLNKHVNFYDEHIYQNLKKDLFDDIIFYITNLDSDNVRNIAYYELLNHTKILIDSFDKDTLNKTLFNNIYESYNVINNKNIYYIMYFFEILIYFYYLYEKGIDNKIKIFVKDILTINKDMIEDFMYTIYLYMYEDNFNFDSKVVVNLKRDLNLWEQKNKNEFINIEDIIEKFVLFFILKWIDDIREFEDIIYHMISGNEFIYYNSYVGSNYTNLNNTAESFRNFIQLFFGESIEDLELDKKMNIFKYALKNIFRDSQLKKSEENKLKKEEINKISSKLNKETLNKIEKNMFAFKDTKVINVKNERFKCFIPMIPISISNCGYVSKQITEEIIRCFISKLIIILQEKKIIKINNCIMKSVLDCFFSSVSESDLNLDTIIRSRNIFWGDKDKRDKFNEFIKNKTDIKISNLTKGIIALDSSKLYINVKNISIHMNKLTENEIENNILKGLEKDDKGRYLYNIMNDIYLLFDKEELLSYISNTRKRIDVDIDMEYGCDADKSGIFVDQK